MAKQERAAFFLKIEYVDKITKEDLTKIYGLKGGDIAYFLDNSILMPRRQGIYSLNKEKIQEKKETVLLELLFSTLQKSDYDEAIRIITTLYEITTDEKFLNFVLFLMSFLIKLPENLSMRVKTLGERDIKDAYSFEKNIIILEAFNYKLRNAFELYSEFYEQKKDLNIKDKLLYFLLRNANICYAKAINRRFELIQTKELTILRMLFRETEENRFISNIEKRDRSLVDLYLAFEFFKVVPKNTKKEDTLNILSELILTGDFEGAEKVAIEYCIDKNRNLSTDLIYNLIHLINELIGSLKKDNTYKETDISTLDLCALFNAVYGFLNAEYDALKNLYIFLDQVGKLESAFIIVGHIRLSLIRKDFEFKELLDVYKDVMKGTFEFNKDEYISRFQESIAHNNLKEANVLLDILVESDTLDSDELISLKSTLEDAKPKVFDIKPIE